MPGDKMPGVNDEPWADPPIKGGSLRIDEFVLPIVDLGLAGGAIVVQIEIAVTEANEAALKALGPDTMVMLYGGDGVLVTRGRLGEDWAPVAFSLPGDRLIVSYRLHVVDQMTEGARRTAQSAGR